MEFFKQTTIDFMALKKQAAIFSFLLMVVCCASIYQYSIPLGLDFTGGVQVEMRFTKKMDPIEARNALTAQPALKDARIQNIGTSYDIMLRSPADENAEVAEVIKAIKATYPDVSITRKAFIGPQVGEGMFYSGVTALLIASLLTLAYIAVRFEWRFAISAILALIHDPILILGVFSYWQVEFDLIGLAALLTVFGYSLNDTIVVYDRVRENFRKYKDIGVNEVLNQSINQTLSRTIMTSSLTLIVVLALLFLGGESLFAFALALSVGIIIGTYSSIYVAGAFSVWIGLKREHLLQKRTSATGPVV